MELCRLRLKLALFVPCGLATFISYIFSNQIQCSTSLQLLIPRGSPTYKNQSIPKKMIWGRNKPRMLNFLQLASPCHPQLIFRSSYGHVNQWASQMFCDTVWHTSWISPIIRVATDLKVREFEWDLWKSGKLPKKSGNLGHISKRQGKVREFCCLKFIFSQVKNPNFENFLGEHAPRLP